MRECLKLLSTLLRKRKTLNKRFYLEKAAFSGFFIAYWAVNSALGLASKA